MALTALGILRNRAHYDDIARYLDDRSSIVSLSAARALMQLDPQRAIALFVPQIVARPDWSQSGVAQILKDAGPAAVSGTLGEVVLQANADVAPRLIRFLADVNPGQANAVIRKLLRTSADEHLISTCLQVMSSQADLDLVRPLLSRERWHVRMHAATAIGRLGGAGDEQLLVPLLADAQWWVRYRAAQALIRLPSMHEGGITLLRETQTDRFACDILDQVLAEEKIGVQR
jgi:HEAT repeat protein